MEIKPMTGGFVRPFGTAWFVIEALKGNAPEGSKRIDPAVGAPMSDIHFEYKNALHRAHARDLVEKEEEKRIRNGGLAYTEEQFTARLEYYLNRIPYKLLKMRYGSFTRYFGHLKRLGWVAETGKTEPSTLQDYYPAAPSRVFYHLTDAGWKASMTEIADPLMALYHYSRVQRSAKNHRYTRL